MERIPATHPHVLMYNYVVDEIRFLQDKNVVGTLGASLCHYYRFVNIEKIIKEINFDPLFSEAQQVLHDYVGEALENLRVDVMWEFRLHRLQSFLAYLEE